MEYEGLQQQEQSDHADAERYRQEAEEGEAKVAALHEASLEAFRVGDMQRGQSLNEEAVKWVLLCLPHGCYSAFHMGATLPFTWVLLCLSHGCYSAFHVGATLPVTWVLLCLPHGCYSAFHMGATLPFTWVLLCLSHGCYSACHMGATQPAICMHMC